MEPITEIVELGVSIGKEQTFGLIARGCTAAQAEYIRKMKQSDSYKILGLTWDQYCPKYRGISRVAADELVYRLAFPNYERESWVAIQSYATESWPDLVNLWLLLNRHLLHVIRAVTPSNPALTCVIGGKDPIPLSALIDGYVDHLEHHLDGIIRLTP